LVINNSIIAKVGNLA
jgi:hypothetical protein